MASIIIPRDWRAQPRGPVEPDHAHPLNQSLVSLWTPCMAFNDASGLSGDVRSAPAVAAVASGSRFGKTVNFGQNGLQLEGTKPVTAPPGLSALVLGGRPPSNQSWSCGILTPYGSLRKWSGYYTIHSAAGGRTTLASALQWPVEPALVIAGRDGGTTRTGLRFLVNGANALNASDNAATAYSTVSYQVMQSTAGDRSAATYWAAPTALMGMWTRYFTDEEAAELNQNPWQIFKPRRQVLYFGGSSGPATHNLQGVAAAEATASGNLTAGGQTSLAGGAGATATAAGDISVGKDLAGAPAAEASALGTLTSLPTAWEFVGSAAASVATGDITLALPAVGPTPILRGVDYSPTIGLFAAVGDDGAVLTSPDGEVWTPRMSGIEDGLSSICHGGQDGRFVAVAISGKNVLTSTDGRVWVAAESGTSVFGMNSVCYSPDLGLFAAVGASGRIMTSPDGEVWTAQTSGITNALYVIAYGNGLFAAAGDGGKILTSPDGITWTLRTSGTTLSIRSIIYAAGQFVAGFYGKFLTSPNGITWTERVSSVSAISYGIAYSVNDGLYVAAGFGGNIVTSPDAVLWTTQAAGVTTNLQSVAYDATNDVLTVVGVDNVRLRSSNAVAWTNHTPTFALREGDLIVAMIAYRDSVPFSLPAGWVEIAQQSLGNVLTTPADSIASGLMAYCIRGATDPSLNFVRAGGDVAHAQTAVYRGM